MGADLQEELTEHPKLFLGFKYLFQLTIYLQTLLGVSGGFGCSDRPRFLRGAT